MANSPNSRLTEFERYRARCFGIAYRMLGSRAEAEDILQEAWLRWSRSEEVASPGAWLTTTVTHLCLDHAKSARVRREQYVGPWLPEPLETTTETAESERVDPETLSVAFLLVLERLTPTERAVFLLRKVFDSDYGEIASTLDKSEEAVRQLFHRAEKHMTAAKPRFAPSREKHIELLSRFMMSVQMGDTAAVEALLADDARAWTDGGGVARAALRVVAGRDRVARFFVGLVKKGEGEGIETEVRDLNGWPAVILWKGNAVHSAMTIETDGETIFAVHTVINPAKLGALSRGT